MRKLFLISSLLFFTLVSRAATDINFYGHEVTIYSDAFPKVGIQSLSENGLRYFDKRLPDNEVAKLARETQHHADIFNLDDVGTIQLVKSISNGIYPDNHRRQILRWKVLSKMGYRVVLAYDARNINTFGMLGFHPNNSVYMYIRGERFTNLDFHDERLLGKRKIYGEVYQGRSFFVNWLKKPRINKLKRKKDLVIYWKSRKLTFTAEGNQSLMQYMEDLPSMDFSSSYLQFGVSEELRNSLFRELESEMAQMGQKEKLSFLLFFVQNAFKYATDGQHHGREKYNYPEETVFDSYSDCEDRAMLLSCLYKELLGLNSIALLYKDERHLSMAVNVPGTTVGGSFRYEGKPFYVCEPAGINYRFGVSAYDLKNVDKVYALY